MSRLAQALARVVAELAALGSDAALIGGLAVGARAQERFTRDIDLAVAVENDAQAERIVFELQRRGYSVIALKVLARDDVRRPQDRIDLVNLVGGATAEQLEAARDLLRRIQQRGFARGRELKDAFEPGRHDA